MACFEGCAGLGLAFALAGGSARAQYDAPPDPNAYVAGPTVYPATLPPDPIPEYQPPAPGYGFSWINGYWDWTGYDWTWNNGYWVKAGRVGATSARASSGRTDSPSTTVASGSGPTAIASIATAAAATSPLAGMPSPVRAARLARRPGSQHRLAARAGSPAGGWREAPRFEHRREMEHREARGRDGAPRDGASRDGAPRGRTSRSRAPRSRASRGARPARRSRSRGTSRRWTTRRPHDGPGAASRPGPARSASSRAAPREEEIGAQPGGSQEGNGAPA